MADFDPRRPFSRQTGFDPNRSFERQASTPQPEPRSLVERLRSTFVDTAHRNPLAAGGRWMTGRGPVGTYDVRDPETGQVIGQHTTTRAEADAIQADIAGRERTRREQYEARATADPWNRAPGGVAGRAAAGGATLLGAVAGGASDPVNWLGGAPKSVAGRIAEGAIVNAAGDAVTQGIDRGTGVQDGYNPMQTVFAAGIGAAIQGGVEGAPAAARGIGSAARSGFDYSRWAAGRASEGLSRALDSRVPSFDGPSMDAAPQPAPRRPRMPVAADAAPVAFLSPVPSGSPISSDYGPRRRPIPGASTNHRGVDYAVPTGTPVSAIADGEVVFAGRAGGYGRRVVIRHADGSESTYSHLNDFDVSQGDRVRAGQSFARSGASGNVSGPHLHFEVRRGGQFVNPTDALSGAPGRVGDAAPAFASETPRRPTVSEAEQLTPTFIDPDTARQSLPERGRSEALGLDGLGIARQDRPGFDASRPFERVDAGGVQRTAPELEVRRGDFDPARPFERQSPEQPSIADARFPISEEVAAPRLVSPEMVPPAGARFDQGDVLAARAAPETPMRSDQPLAVDLSRYSERLGEVAPSSGQRTGGLREAPRPDAVAQGQGEAFAGRTVSDLAADLRAALGLTHRQGRVAMKGALGTYDTGSGVVRTKAVDELDVLAHEATHALEYERAGPMLRQAFAAHAAELKAMAYPGAAESVRREEGFAEFGRWYLTNPDHARLAAPGFYEAFEQALATDAPAVLKGLQGVQAGYQNLLRSSSLDVAKGSLAYTGSRGPIGDLTEAVRRRGPGSVVRGAMDRLYTWLIDDLHPLSVAERELGQLYLQNTGQRLDPKRAESPYALARLTREAYAAGHSDLMQGVVPYRGLDSEGASLADALETAGLGRTVTGKFEQDALRELDVYLISRRMVHEWDRYGRGELPNPPDRNTRQFHEQVIADAEARHPTWQEAAGQVYEFLNNLWRKEYDAGLITREAYENGLTNHPDYVPLMRDMSDKGPGRAGKPRGALQFAGGVKAFEGSTRDVISPLSSIMRRAYELNAIIRRNDVMKSLDDMAEAAGRGSGAFVERLPAHEVEAVTVDARQALERVAEEMGLTGRDLTTMQKFADDAASQDATIQLFRQSEFSPRKGEAVVFVWRNGKKTPLLLADGEFGQEMYRALTGLTPDLSNIAVDIMAAGTQVLRYGVTTSPEFMGANIVRDALATWINSDVGFVPLLDTIRGGVSEVGQDQSARRYAVAGGMRGGANTAATSNPFPRTDAAAEAQLQHLRRKGWRLRRYASWRGFAELTDLSETATRVGVFRRGFDQAKARGLTDYEALIESGFTSRDYLDFGRRGSKMLTAARLVTFLNAALQGLDKTARVLTAGGRIGELLTTSRALTESETRARNHALKAMAKISVLGALGLGLRALYSDDPEYEEINDRLRATHWVAKINGQWVFVPKPFELAAMSNVLERAYEGSVLKDPRWGERLLSDMQHTVAPPAEIPALAVPFHLARNRDYLGRPIVPDHLKGTVDPQYQVNAYTSDLGKVIGRTFNLSPAQVDYVMTGFGGSWGRYVQQASNVVGDAVTGAPQTAAGPADWFLARRFIRQIDRGSNSQAEFWDHVSRDGGTLTRAEGTFRALFKEGKDAEATAYLNRLQPDERAYVLAKVFSEDGSSRDHPMVRAQGVVSVLGDFRSSLRDGEVRDFSGQPIALTPRQRRAIDDALADMAMAEMRNALIETGVEGWSNRDRMDTTAPAARIGQTSPDVAYQLQEWLRQSKAATVFHPDALAASQQRWQTMQPFLVQPADPVSMTGALQRERMTGDRLNRYREGLRMTGAAATTPPPAGAGMMTGAR